MTNYGYGNGSMRNKRGGVCEGLRNNRGNGGGIGFTDGHGFGDSLGRSIDTIDGRGSGGGKGRTQGTRDGKYDYDDSNGMRTLCPIKGETVYVARLPVLETKFTDELEMFYFTHEEAEAALAVKLLGKDD
jgi:hypothetical protein